MTEVSGRDRANRDPFWATGLNRMDSGVADIVKNLHLVVERSPELGPYMWPGSGYRSNSQEHGSGRAIDWMITENTGVKPSKAERNAGKKFCDFLIKHGKVLGLQWVLFSLDDQVTWSYNMDRGSWVKLSDRGSVSGNHRDHVHAYFKRGAQWSKALVGAVIGTAGSVPQKPGPPSTGASGATWDGKSFPGTAVFRNGLKSDATKVLQQRLKAHGYDPGPVDSYWGIKTQTAVRRFQVAQGWTGRDADGLPGPVTWKRLMAAPSPATVKPKSISQMATEVIAGKHGTGHVARRKSLGVDAATYEKVRAEVNRRV